MKKLLVIALSAALCLAVAMPAMAKVNVGGMISTDFFYLSQDEQLLGGTEGLDRTFFQVPQALNRLNVSYANDDNSLRGYIQVRFGVGTGRGITESEYWELAYIDWQINPANYLRFGRQTQTFAIYAPQQMLGQGSGHIVGAGFGNVHGGTARTGVRWYSKFSDAARLEVQLLDPDNDNGEALFIGAPPTTGNAVNEENVLPRLDVSVPLTFGNFTIEPSGTYLTQDYTNIAAGIDDSADAWGLACGLGFSAGMFSFNGEIVFGQNLGSGNYVGGGLPASGYDSNADGIVDKVEDTDVLSYWLQVGLKLGPSTLYLIYGNINVQNDNDGALGAKTDYDQTMYGISWPISIAKGFTIRPELMFYDYDDSAQVKGSTRDNGSEWVLGLQAMLVF